MAKTYREAETVAMIASGLIPNHHPELVTAKIMYIHVDKASSKGGVKLAAKVKKLSGFTEWAVKHDFVIEVAEDLWNEMDSGARTATVDDALERCTADEGEDGSMVWKVRDPDVQVFVSILQRYGVYHEGLQSLVDVAKAIGLDEIVEEEGEVDLADSLIETTTNT